MSEISFKSTYRIPITQSGMNKTKKISLKSLVESYGGMVGTGNTGYARVSIPDSKDAGFVRKLKGIGYKVFQVFQGENIKKNELDNYIKKMMESAESTQQGASKATIAKNSEAKTVERTFGNWEKDTNKTEQDQIRQTQEYKNLVKKYGEEFAEAVYFFTKK